MNLCRYCSMLTNIPFIRTNSVHSFLRFFQSLCSWFVFCLHRFTISNKTKGVQSKLYIHILQILWPSPHLSNEMSLEIIICWYQMFAFCILLTFSIWIMNFSVIRLKSTNHFWSSWIGPQKHISITENHKDLFLSNFFVNIQTIWNCYNNDFHF